MSNYINNKEDLEFFLNIEKEKYNRKSIITPLICIRESDFLWKHNILLRRTEYYINTNKKIRGLFYKLRLFLFQNRHQIHIPINTFGYGLKIMHLGPILVNSNVRAGNHISLHINTSIVAGGSNNKVPTLGNGVVLGVGAVVLGDIEIADNIAIGANSVVNKSFYEEDITIAGAPAKKISDNGRTKWSKHNIKV